MDSITAIFIVVSVIILISYYIPRLSFNGFPKEVSHPQGM